jgi:hypothetical protein
VKRSERLSGALRVGERVESWTGDTRRHHHQLNIHSARAWRNVGGRRRVRLNYWQEAPVQTYAMLRRNGWRSPDDLKAAGERSTQVGEDMSDDVRWIRSYVLEESSGSLGTVCIYQATSAEALRQHASLADLPLDEIIPVADTVVVRPDPEAAVA